jgi:hypothetical protein
VRRPVWLMGRVRLPGCGGGGSGGTATLWLPALLLLLLLTVGVLVGTFALFYRVSCRPSHCLVQSIVFDTPARVLLLLLVFCVVTDETCVVSHLYVYSLI